ncbi:NADH dehydrogenase (quinone) subunit G [Desulfonema ishimotonii]|uniref:NADH dehydrogenase (Quinone) subunit G n=1 Tax=Desulfonema ishimotonii TaxID=45657 RepID=A0A401G057_9BACT|nr:NADH-quinone oxidoreductase subunit NuoG [Desulfonema ishimotonii]GBC62601.1 NADH dehydrogenase (quinone) subunit G [Desulfonema ishimotonii]
MPKLIIDNREIEVPPGTRVIEAAEMLGITIPRFCYHPALGPVGACRVCAVKFLDGPVKGVQMSCMVAARDGMVVSTTDPEAADFRKSVIEFLMLNHPHDCPVCDEGGHCLLQDMTVSGGHGLRRYKGNKRTHNDQYLGPLIQHEMNRCIQCYRCSRFYQEFTGFHDLGVMGIGSRVYFGRYKEGTLESPFAGNLADLCPTGVYTDKPSRFKGRRWDFERRPGLCIHCSLGCHTVVCSRYREVMRQEARFSEAINGYFICDRGRYGFYYAGLDERPRHGRADGQEISGEDALKFAAQRLEKIRSAYGPDAVACAGSPRSSLETLTALKRLCRKNNWRGPAYFGERETAQKVRAAVSRFSSETAVSLRDVEQADFILAVGADPVNEAPMLALAMRQAWRNGARVAVIDPRPVSLPLEFEHLPVRAELAEFYLGTLVNETLNDKAAKAGEPEAQKFCDVISTLSARHQVDITELAHVFQKSQRPVIICGMAPLPEPVPWLVADLVSALRTMNKQAGLFFILPGANAFGAALLSETEISFEQIITDIETARVKALVLVENDPFFHFPDRQRLEKAIRKLELLVVADCLNTPAVGAADIFVPTLTVYEAGGTFITAEGRVQHVGPAFRGGIPITQTGKGDHPPREFRPDISGGDVKAAWQAIAILAGDSESVRKNWLTEAHPAFADLPDVNKFPDDGICLDLKTDTTAAQFSCDWPTEPSEPKDGFELIFTDLTFGTEELSTYSPCLQEMEKKPCLFMQSRDAAELKLSDGDVAELKTAGGAVKIPVKVVENMAPGVLILPRHRQVEWQKLGTRKLRKDQIRKVRMG